MISALDCLTQMSYNKTMHAGYAVVMVKNKARALSIRLISGEQYLVLYDGAQSFYNNTGAGL